MLTTYIISDDLLAMINIKYMYSISYCDFPTNHKPENQSTPEYYLCKRLSYTCFFRFRMSYHMSSIQLIQLIHFSIYYYISKDCAMKLHLHIVTCSIMFIFSKLPGVYSFQSPIVNQKRLTFSSLHLEERDSSALLATANNADDDDERSVTLAKTKWNPFARNTVAGLSLVGSFETAYLTYEKVFVPNGLTNLCSGDESAISSCSSVLTSPYASVHIGDIEVPLTAIGFLAYSTVTALALYPLFESKSNSHDENNRLGILFTTTAMATFSSFLFSLLTNVLHQYCPWCYLSAFLSISMGFISWMSGALPNNRAQDGLKLGLTSFLGTTIAALALFFSVDEASMMAYSNNVMQGNGMSANIVANANEAKLKNVPPPPVTSTSSERALKIGDDLKSLDTNFYGAYWCSHCFEQKQRLGKEAFYSNVNYIECSPEGLNSKSKLCKEKDIPGYPTWEIGGKLFPGEMYLDELEDIIKDVRASKGL